MTEIPLFSHTPRRLVFSETFQRARGISPEDWTTEEVVPLGGIEPP